MRTFKLLLALIPIAVIGTTAASAAPMPKLDGALPAESSLVQKTHGWHRYCTWGPARYHRHVPGYGNVSCGHHHHGYYRPYVRSYVWSGPRYAWRHHGHWRHRGHVHHHRSHRHWR